MNASIKTTDHLKSGLAPLLVFALVIYLAFTGGGYDAIDYGRVGITAWWVVLLGVLMGAFSLDRLPRPARVGIALFAAFAIWTGLSMLWSESAGRSAQEFSRAVGYLGVFVLAAATLQRRGGLRLTLAAVAGAIAAITAISLLARMEPSWFPRNETIDLTYAARARLNYPLNYWNGLAALMAIGAPLLTHFATHGRTVLARGLAAAALPAIALGVYLTLSRGGGVALVAGLAVLVALHPRRRALLPQIGVTALGGAILIWAAHSRGGFLDDPLSASGIAQGHEMLPITLVVCLVAGLSQFAIRAGVARWGDRFERRMPSPRSRRAQLAAPGATVLVVIGLALAIGAPAKIENGWERFKDPEVARSGERLDSASGNGRYQWWSSAVDAFETAPVLGIGSGTFEFWWARNATIPSSVVDAHSLYVETLGELGLVGFLLVVAAVGGIIVLISSLAMRAPPARRSRLAAAAAAAVAFAAAAASDWAWELPILPLCFVLIAGAALGSRQPGSPRAPGRMWLPLAASSVIAIVVIGTQLLGLDAIRSSQSQVASGNLEGALSDAQRARRFEPYSAPAALQEALVLQQMGSLIPSLHAAQAAVDKEPTNWQNWFILSRIQADNARSRRAVTSYRHAERLYRYALFARDAPAEQPTAEGG